MSCDVGLSESKQLYKVAVQFAFFIVINSPLRIQHID